MKSLLAILLSFIMMEAPVFAIHGGYTLGGNGQLPGTYAGTLIPVTETPLNGNSAVFGTNALGLFTMNVPTTGVITGVALIFAQGDTFFGSLEGLPNPNDATSLLGLIHTTYNYNLIVPTTTITAGVTTVTYTTEAVTATAEGNFTAGIETVQNPLNTASSTGVNLSGSANIDVSEGEINANGTPVVTDTVLFDIEGFQQSTGFTSGGTLAATTGT